MANTRYPLTTAPGNAPPGWALTVADQTHVFNEWISCERVKVGAYDRPARLIIDAHNNATPPDTCVEGYVGALFIIEQVLVSDPAIAASLASAFRLPVVVATIEYSTSPGPGAGFVSHNWEWNTTASEASRVALNSTKDDARPYDVTTRYVWENGKGVSFLDLTDNFGLTTVDNNVLVGHMQPPMLYTQGAKPNPYIGQGEVMYDYTFEGEVRAFGDYQCKEPLT